MQNFALIRIFWRSRRPSLSRRRRQPQAGFTLVELLVVVILIGVLAAIAAPSWVSFVQQRRVTVANDAVVRALQQAQSLAKSKKQTYSVSLRISTGVPEIAVYQSKQPDPNDFDPNTPGKQIDITPDKLNASAWQSFSQLGIKGGQIWLGTNASTTTSNTVDKDRLDQSVSDNPNVATITFDYTGALPNTPTPQLGTGTNSQGLIIAVASAQPNSNPPQPIATTRRCVKVSNLIGSIQSGKIDGTGSVDQCKPL